MSRLPTDTAVRHLIDSLRTLSRKGTLDDIEHQLLDAIRRDRTARPGPDGYPTTTGGGNGSGHSDSSSVENAVIARENGHPPDPHHALTRRAAQALEDAVVNLNTLNSALINLNAHTTTQAPRTCQHCTPHLPKGHHRPVHRRGTVGDRLGQALDLCEPCYFYVQRATTAGRGDAEMPTPEQIRQHDNTGTWRMKVA